MLVGSNRMLSASGVPVLLLATLSAYAAGQHCQCSAFPPGGLKVNCSVVKLTALPRLPADTTELFLQDNRLTSVSPGSFDRLAGLRRVALHGNPFHCGCGIQYLRNWLLKNGDVVAGEPVCASPSSVAEKPIRELGDDHFSSCAPKSNTDGALNGIIAATLCCVVVLLLWSLKVAKASNITLIIGERHSGLEAKALNSHRTKHRRRQRAELSPSPSSSDSLGVDLERPLLNMELLPQVLEILHRKHDITINLPAGQVDLLHRKNRHTADMTADV
ncbi:platelet glycoprotein IX [Nelusetta ayraudi]|uniref:platelet glycoprotein IX n=1 Tax=Nelusetta ayraudi TaxID=303726 RepID=UPI003F7184B9